MDRTRNAVERMLGALDAPAYDLGVLSERGMLPCLANLAASGVMSRIPLLKAQNARGAHIYIRPAGEHRYTILDDLATESVERLSVDGYEPCAVVETSLGNFQAWLKHDGVYALWTLDRIVRAVVISGLFSLLITAYVARPITSLTGVAEQFGAGDLKARVVSSTIRRKDELGDLARVFNQMAARIESLVERYKSFLAHVSHELGSPLARLNIALALAKRRAGGQFQAEHDRIGHEAERLSSLVQELLLLARLESGNELSRNSSRFNATKLVEDACEDARLEADQEHKAVQICRAEQFDVEGHPDLLRRALDNVLRNGLRFSQPDGCVEVSCFRKDAATAVIQIQDDGPGILPGQEELIFEPFVTLPGNGDKQRGSGLGLAISRQAIFANGGKIYAQCLPDKGLTVTIELPTASTKPRTANGVGRTRI